MNPDCPIIQSWNWSLIISICAFIFSLFAFGYNFFHRNKLIAKILKLSTGNDFEIYLNISNVGNRKILLSDIEILTKFVGEWENEPMGNPVPDCSSLPCIIDPNEMKMIKISLGKAIIDMAREQQVKFQISIEAFSLKGKEFFLNTEIDFSKKPRTIWSSKPFRESNDSYWQKINK